MTLARLQEILAGFGRLHITVVGDLFLDRWWEVDRSLDEPSVETGLTAYQVTGRRQSAGAAGTVLNNLAALGVGDVQAVSMVGDDGEGFELLRLLEKAGIGTAGVAIFLPPPIQSRCFPPRKTGRKPSTTALTLKTGGPHRPMRSRN